MSSTYKIGNANAAVISNERVLYALARIVNTGTPFILHSDGNPFCCKYCHEALLGKEHAADCPIVLIRAFIMQVENQEAVRARRGS